MKTEIQPENDAVENTAGQNTICVIVLTPGIVYLYTSNIKYLIKRISNASRDKEMGTIFEILYRRVGNKVNLFI